MKIIAKRSDYYDSVQGSGIDENTVYIREPRKIELDKQDDDFRISLINSAPRFDNLESSAFIIGFCGKIFPVIELHITIKKYKYNDNVIKTFYVYTYSDLVDILKKYKFKEYLKAVQDKCKYSYKNKKRQTIDFFGINKQQNKFEKFFFDNKSPVFVITGKKEIQVGTEINCLGTKFPKFEDHGIMVNNNLLDLEFYKIFNSFAAFQEIQMYLGGVIPKDTPDVINISNSKMIEKKGFNDASFRKMPDTRDRKQKTGKIKKNLI